MSNTHTDELSEVLDVKNPITYDEQVKRISEKGFIIEDSDSCKEFLKEANYYRLLAYYLPFKKKDGTYFKGIPFKRIQRIYEFDSHLRSVLSRIIEFFSMGTLSYLYTDLLTPDKKQIASTSFNTSADCLQNWLRCLTDLRNRCAHYSKLYYWIFSAVPKTPQNAPYTFDRKRFSQILMLKYLYPNKSKWNSSVSISIEALIDEYLPDISLKHIGFPANWKELLKV